MVDHNRAEAYALASVPHHIGEAVDCDARLEGSEFPEEEIDDPEHGRFYASGFRLQEKFGNPAVLYLLWEERGGDWKVVAYDILTP
jgi:hypothetical protein